MNINEITLREFSKDELIGVLCTISKRKNCDGLVAIQLRNIIRERGTRNIEVDPDELLREYRKLMKKYDIENMSHLEQVLLYNSKKVEKIRRKEQRKMKHAKLKYVLDIVGISLTILCAMVGIFIGTIAWTSLIR